MALNKFHSNLMGLQSNMLGFAMILTSNSKDAYNLVQDTTLNALDRQSEYAEGTNLKNWVFTLMRDIFIAGKKNTSLALASDVIEQFSISYSKTGLETPEGCFSAEQVSEKMQNMDTVSNRVFSLHLKGYSVTEIAYRMDMKVGKIKSIIRQACRNIQY